MIDKKEMDMIAKISPTRYEPYQGNDNVIIAEMIKGEAAKGKMPVVGHNALPGHDHIPAAKLIGDPPDLLEKTAHVRIRGEKFMSQFYARVGLGPGQIRSMTKEQITEFCQKASAVEYLNPRPRGIPVG